MTVKWKDVEADERYQQLDDEQKARLKGDFWSQRVADSEEYAALDEGARTRLHKEFFGSLPGEVAQGEIEHERTWGEAIKDVGLSGYQAASLAVQGITVDTPKLVELSGAWAGEKLGLIDKDEKAEAFGDIQRRYDPQQKALENVRQKVGEEKSDKQKQQLGRIESTLEDDDKGMWDVAVSLVENPSGAVDMAVQSLADTVIGGVAGKVRYAQALESAYKAGAKKGLTGEALKKEAEKKALKAAGVTGTAVESLQAAAHATAGQAEQIAQYDDKTLAGQSPRFRELVAAGVPSKDARDILAAEAGLETAGWTGAGTFLGGVLFKSGEEVAKVFTGKASKDAAAKAAASVGVRGAAKAVASGVPTAIGKEAGQEFLQSGAEALGGNIATRNTIDENQEVFDASIGKQAVLGAGLGGITGGGMRLAGNVAGVVGGKPADDAPADDAPTPPTDDQLRAEADAVRAGSTPETAAEDAEILAGIDAELARRGGATAEPEAQTPIATTGMEGAGQQPPPAEPPAPGLGGIAARAEQRAQEGGLGGLAQPGNPELDAFHAAREAQATGAPLTPEQVSGQFGLDQEKAQKVTTPAEISVRAGKRVAGRDSQVVSVEGVGDFAILLPAAKGDGFVVNRPDGSSITVPTMAEAKAIVNAASEAQAETAGLPPQEVTPQEAALPPQDPIAAPDVPQAAAQPQAIAPAADVAPTPAFTPKRFALLDAYEPDRMGDDQEGGYLENLARDLEGKSDTDHRSFNPDHHTMADAVAMFGGIDGAHAGGEFDIKTLNKGRVGKPVIRAKGKGLTPDGMAEALTEAGFRTRGGQSIDPNSLSEMLDDESRGGAHWSTHKQDGDYGRPVANTYAGGSPKRLAAIVRKYLAGGDLGENQRKAVSALLESAYDGGRLGRVQGQQRIATAMVGAGFAPDDADAVATIQQAYEEQVPVEDLEDAILESGGFIDDLRTTLDEMAAMRRQSPEEGALDSIKGYGAGDAMTQAATRALMGQVADEQEAAALNRGNYQGPRKGAGQFAQPYRKQAQDAAKRAADVATAEGIKPESAAKMFEALFPRALIDAVTGFYKPEDRYETMQRAIDYVGNTKAAGFYVEVDLSNLGGLNEKMGNSEANVAYRRIAKIISNRLSTHLAKNNPSFDQVNFRHGGDEMSFFVFGDNLDHSSIEDVLRSAQEVVWRYARDIGVHEIPHAKTPDDPKRVGVNFNFGVTQVQKTKTPEATFKEADLVVEKRKKEPSYGYRKGEAAGAARPDAGAAGSQDGGDPGRGGDSGITGAQGQGEGGARGEGGAADGAGRDGDAEVRLQAGQEGREAALDGEREGRLTEAAPRNLNERREREARDEELTLAQQEAPKPASKPQEPQRAQTSLIPEKTPEEEAAQRLKDFEAEKEAKKKEQAKRAERLPDGPLFDGSQNQTDIESVDLEEAGKILEAAGIEGKDRLDSISKVRRGEYTLDDLRAAFPQKEPAKEEAAKPDEPTAEKAEATPEAEKPEADRIDDFGEKIGGARKDVAEKGGSKVGGKKSADERPAWARRFEVSRVAKSMRPEEEGRWIIRDTRKKDGFGQEVQVGPRDGFATQEEAEAGVQLVAVAQKHRPVPGAVRGTYEIWRDINDRKRVKVVDRVFDSREEAMRYMAENAVEILETNTTFGEADLPRPDSTARIGEARRTGDVRGEDFMRVFGFRGVEFGNWNNQADRQDLLNDAYDGLLDLAEVMNIPPKAISLNGDLALAFGARGHGLSSARAHYEPDRAVINLTKMNGAGSLAHEWFHGLDHYLGRQDGKASSEWVVGKDGTRSLKVKGSFEGDAISAGNRGDRSGMRAELRQAIVDVMKVMSTKAEKYVEDTTKADDFVGRTRKDVSDTLAGIRKYLAEPSEYQKRNNKPASAEQLAEFDAIAERIVAGEALETRLVATDKKPRTMLSGMRWSNDALEQINAIMKAVRGRQGFAADNKGTLDGLRASMTRYSERLKMLADAQSGAEKTKAVPTSFRMDARELDQGRGEDYWTTPHEMAARAFQGYVEDKIAAKGGKSPFLNYAPERAAILTPWGWKRPYPHGDERKAINAAFDRLVDTIQTRETDAGVAMFSLRPETKAAYEARIDALFAGAAPNREGIRVLDRSDVLDLLDYGDMPVVLHERHAIEDGRYQHPLTAEQWKKVPEWLENPVAVFKRDDGHLTVVTDEIVDGNPIVIGLDPASRPAGGRGGSARHLLLTAYARDRGNLPVGRMIRDGNLLFVDARKSPGFNAGSGLRLPSSGVDLRGLPNKVKTGADLFNYRQTDGKSETPKARLSAGGRPVGIPRKEAQRLLNEHDASVKAVQSYADLDPEIRAEAEQQGAKPSDIKGVHWRGKSWVVADNVTADEVVRVALHEGMHGKLRQAYGREVENKMVLLASNLPGTDKASLRVLALAESQGIVLSEYVKGLNKDATKTDRQKLAILTEELLTHVEEGRVTAKGKLKAYLEAVVGAIRAFLRKHGFSQFADYGITDIQHLLRQAREYGEQIEMAGEVPAFSRREGDPEADAPRFSIEPGAGLFDQDVRYRTDGKPWANRKNAEAAIKARGLEATHKPVQTKAGWVLAKAAVPPKETAFRKAQRRWQDKFNRFRVIQDWLAENGISLTEQADVFGAEALMRGRQASRIEDFREKQVRPLMKRIAKAEISMAGVSDFLHAQHAAERNRQTGKVSGREGGSGMSDRDAAEKLAEYQKNPQLVALANEYRAITDQTRQMLLDSGIISQEQADAWQGAYQHYVPLKGGQDEAIGNKKPGGAGVFHRATGHEQREDGEWIAENILRDHEWAIMQVERNRVGKALLNLALESGDHDLITIDKPEKRAVLKNGKAYVVTLRGQPLEVLERREDAEALVAALGSKMAGASPQDYAIETTTNPSVIYQARPQLADNETVVYVAGNKVRIQFNDPLVARSWNNLGEEQMNVLLRMGKELNNWLSRAYTGYNPQFLFTNVARDLIGGTVNLAGEHGALFAGRTLLNYPKAWAALARHEKGGDKLIKEYRDDGGSIGAAYLSDLERIGADVEATYDEYRGALQTLKNGGSKRAAKAAFRKLVGAFVGWIEVMNRVGENALRVAAYQTAREAKMSRHKAAVIAKESTINFSRRGEVGQVAGALYLFFNPAVQGTAVIAHALAKGKNKHQAQAMVAGLATLGYLLAQSFGGGPEDEWEKASDYEKERNFLIWTGSRYLKIPVPYGYGAAPTAGRYMAEVGRGSLPMDEAALRLAATMIGEFTLFGAAANPDGDTTNTVFLLPTAAQIPASVAVNRTSFGSPVYPDSKFTSGETPDSQQMFRSSVGTHWEAIAKGMNTLTGGDDVDAGKVDVSPETLKYLTHTFTGGAGKFVSDSVTLAANLAGGVTDIEAREVPIARSFVGNSDSLPGARSRFYRASDKVRAAEDRLRRAEKLLDGGDLKDKAAQIEAEQGFLLNLGDSLKEYSGWVKEVREEIVGVQRQDLPTAEKRQKIKALEQQEAALYDEFMRIFKEEERKQKVAG